MTLASFPQSSCGVGRLRSPVFLNHKIMANIIFQIETPEDMTYYIERAQDIIEKRGFQYLTTNHILHEMRNFVQNTKDPITIKFRKGELELST